MLARPPGPRAPSPVAALQIVQGRVGGDIQITLCDDRLLLLLLIHLTHCTLIHGALAHRALAHHALAHRALAHSTLDVGIFVIYLGECVSLAPALAARVSATAVITAHALSVGVHCVGVHRTARLGGCVVAGNGVKIPDR
eukprot:scaffold165467_cov26-Tisochrysis_lutea.AAC.2